jgi:hypothetical protein
MTRILLLSCSGRKRATLVPLPAGQLYTGVFYTMIAKARREQQWPSDITIGIVSAEHGFLKETDLLLPYDRRMDESRARELQRAIGESLDAFFSQHQPTESMVALGNPYRLSIAILRSWSSVTKMVRWFGRMVDLESSCIRCIGGYERSQDHERLLVPRSNQERRFGNAPYALF